MNSRITSIKFGIITISLILLGRFFYWQVLSSDKLAAIAQTQRTSTRTIPADRGSILTSDGFAIVTNTPSYLVYAYTPDLTSTPGELTESLGQYLLETENLDATEAAKPAEIRLKETKLDLLAKLSNKDKTWIPLKRKINNETKEVIEGLGLSGIGFDEHKLRYYPESSSSAHLLGFVGRDESGEPLGYFGLEGYYDLELRGKSGVVRQEKDPLGKPIVIGEYSENTGRAGKDLLLNLNRGLQHIVEKHLEKALEKYEATSGEVLIMDPHTGAILAMASEPSYDPGKFINYDTALYKNPIVSSSYEPGSTFKVLIMAAGIEEGVITPETVCDQTCDQPVEIGQYTIKTWNDKYIKDQTMTEVLAHSDNTGMIFVGRKLGEDKLIDYIKKFGIGTKTGIDLQEESAVSLRSKWSEVDLATATFGQGLVTTAIQMATAVSAIANGGNLVTPQVVREVRGKDVIQIKPQVGPRIISKETAESVTKMMVAAVDSGDAKWARPKGYKIAGKTGTAQIAVGGRYDASKTIASFIGFAPADDPKFVMITKLTEPKTSQWGSETAAPLWFEIATDVLFTLGIAPKN